MLTPDLLFFGVCGSPSPNLYAISSGQLLLSMVQLNHNHVTVHGQGSTGAKMNHFVDS